MAGTIPTTIESLSTTAASNDPTEGSGAAMTLVNDGLRAAYAFVRQTVTAGSDIASASTITPPSTGSSFNLTGTTTVTAIGSTNSWDGRIVWFRHTGAHSFTNSATLVCLGGASITFASGDISAWRQRIPGTWDQIVYFKASALPVYAGGTASLGNTTVSGTLAVTGNSTIAGTLGGLTGLTVDSGGASITGNTTVSGGTFAARGFADNATAAAWNIDASGRLLNNGGAQPFLKVSRSSNQTSGTTVIFNAEAIDRGGQYDNTTGIWTVPVSGDYGLRGVLTIGNSSGASGARIVTIAGSTTGTVYSCRVYCQTGEPVAIPLNIDATLVAAETVTVTVDIAFAANFLLEANRCFFSARLLG